VDLSLGTIDPSDIITKRTFLYNRHPAEDNFQQTATYDNTTDRDRYCKGTQHNETVELEALVNCGDNTNSIYDTGSSDGDNAPNETIARYYDRITSQPRILVKFTMVNKRKSKVEIGDIIQLSITNIAPYNDTWATLYFMVIDEGRNLNGLNITAREVYNA
jgi:hypothetical protein